MCLTCFLKMQAGRFRPAALKFRPKRFFENHFLTKDEKWWKYMIRPAKCYFNGFMKPFIKGADKNHNPRKGTETVSSSRLMILSLIVDKNHNPRKETETSLPAMCPSIRTVWIRTIIPARGRKPEDFAIPNIRRILIRTIIPARGRVRKKQLNRRSSPCWENVDD